MGAAEEFDAFVAARGPALLRTGYLLTADRGLAEDLVQAALERAWLRWHRIGGLDHVEAYVRRIVVTTHLSWWRRRRVTEVPLDPAATGGGAADHAPAAGVRRDVLEALRRLPRGQRAVVVLRYYEDLTEAETAAVLGCSVGTVKSQTARALARLRGDDSLREFRLAVSKEVSP